jgi:hypothetical protein
MMDSKKGFTPYEWYNSKYRPPEYPNDQKGYRSQTFHNEGFAKAKETAKTARKYINDLKTGALLTIGAEGLNAAADYASNTPNVINGVTETASGALEYLIPGRQETAKEAMKNGLNEAKTAFNNTINQARADNEAFIKKYGYDPHANYVDYGQGFATKDEVDAAVAGTKRGTRNYELHKDVKSGKITREEQQKQMKKYDDEVLGLKAQQKTTEKAPAAATTEQQQQAAQSPAESWPQERARLAKEMQDSIKANPNDPSKWKVPQGWGAVRGSDGEMRYEIPDQPFDPVKAREEEMIARAQVDYDTAKSYAMSPYSSPSFRAAQLDIMEQLKRDYPGIGQQQGGGLIVANGRAGLRGGSNAIDPAVKLALEQQEQMRKLEAENIEKMVEDAKRMDPDNPVGQAEDIARALLAPQTFGRVNPYEPVMQAWQRANALNHNVINKTLRDNGIYDFESTNVRKDLPTLKNLTNSITNNLFGTEFFDDEYMVGDNVIDASKLAPVSKRSMDNTDAYNTYLRQAEAQGIRPMDYTTWLLTGGYRG